MKPAWRGVVFEGEVWAWPMVLMDHDTAFMVMPMLRDCTCRWRQWNPGGQVEFDTPVSAEDQALVEAWVERNS